ncbi:MAG TPA: preprotein translocase subunit SecG [Saprospiraceae bacterium]|nr:preprotein translocase subunit SecG [Saprospiraceae bacterium]
MVLTLITILIAITCVLLIASVLIQNPKGGGIDATFGASANQMFGAAKSADFVEKLTWYLAATLFILCILTAIMTGGGAVDPTDIPNPAQAQ